MMENIVEFLGRWLACGFVGTLLYGGLYFLKEGKPWWWSIVLFMLMVHCVMNMITQWDD